MHAVVKNSTYTNQRFSLRRLFVVIGVVACVFAAIGYFVRVPQYLRNLGRAKAEQDWQNQEAKIFSTSAPSPSYFKGHWITHSYDSASGLKFLRSNSEAPDGSFYSKAYNKRIEKLLKDNGTPKWSRKDQVVPNDKLIRMLTSGTMQRIDQFPHEVNENVVLKQNKRANSLSIFVKNGVCGSGMEKDDDPIFVGTNSNYPDLVFVRVGDYCLLVVCTDGELISTVRRVNSSCLARFQPTCC